MAERPSIAAGLGADLVLDLAAVQERDERHVAAHGRPFVSLKAASSLDGRIATAGGDSKWITGEDARRVGHGLRATHGAIAVGAGTVLSDDPRLDTRLVEGPNPTPVVFDSSLRTAVADGPRLLREGSLFVHTRLASRVRRQRVEDAGARAIEVAADGQGRVDPGRALDALLECGHRSLLVEGGGALLGSFVAAGCWDRLYHFTAPRLLGEGRPVIAGVQWPTVAEAPQLRVESRHTLGDDLLTVLAPG